MMDRNVVVPRSQGGTVNPALFSLFRRVPALAGARLDGNAGAPDRAEDPAGTVRV
jgi:hypothetical protein